MTQIKNLDPKIVWKNFYLLTQVPRPSGHLQQIQQFLLDWAEKHGIEARKDRAKNIIMRKPATAGREDAPCIVLQAHMDMVPQKTDESRHDFETDAIEAYIDGDWVKAKGTTLGSDDGIGVAAIMAVLESNDIRHGRIEALFTADEETCMYGVSHLSPNTLTGSILLNIDNETMGEFVIGSAGGINISASMKYRSAKPEDDIAVRITVKGLRGGHSGLEINQGRANANKLMAHIVNLCAMEHGARICTWQGGNMRNAIPRTAEVVLSIPLDCYASTELLTRTLQEEFADIYRGIEDNITVTIEQVPLPERQVPAKVQDNLLNAIITCHDGVFRNIPDIPSVVETSSNLGIVNINENSAEILILARSSNELMLRQMVEMHESCFTMAGMKVVESGYYPAWQPNLESPVTAKMTDVYRRLFGEEAKVQVCHAGLECSLIGKVYPNMDLVSLGPTLRSPHTPDERCNIPSVKQFWIFLRELLEAF
ncbi:MAG: aminoacyl-histidine dipeptidase [Prevotellaceae bacterium]|nr:aminoacyl-histidine dipeptidase [Prevotellaceae bacterium]